MKNPVGMDSNFGGDISIYSNTTVDGVKYGELDLLNTSDQPIDVTMATLKLAGTFNRNAWVEVAYGNGSIQAGSADEGGLAFGANEEGDEVSLNITLTGADDEFAEFNSEDGAPDDLVLVKGGNDELASRVNVANLDAVGKKYCVVKYDAAQDAVVLHKIIKGLYVNGVDGSDDNAGTRQAPLKTMEAALAKYKEHEYEAIYVTGTVAPGADEWDGAGALVLRGPDYQGVLVDVPSGTSLSIGNMTIDGNKQAVTKADTLLTVEGNLTLGEGAVLQNNSASKDDLSMGGAMRAGGQSTVTLNAGSQVRDNDATWGGGVYSAGNLVVNGGQVTGNKAYDAGDWEAAGGGICMNNYDNGLVEGLAANLTFNSGSVSNNWSAYMGGGIALRPVKTNDKDYPDQRVTMVMTGGDVDGNTAESAGGGIYVNIKSVATISAGNITNNQANGYQATFSGGGIYVNGVSDNMRSTYPNGQLFITNVIVTGNSATGNGGGLGDCPTSTVKMYVTEGGAIYENSADGGVNEVYTQDGAIWSPYGSHEGTPNIVVSPVMLGGGGYLWKYAQDTPDGLHKAGDLVDTADMANAHVIALNNDVKTGSKETEAAQSLARVYITGNRAVGAGGGIGTDGDVTIGKPGGLTDIQVQKSWANSNSSNIPDAVKLILQSKTSDDAWSDVAYATAAKDSDPAWYAVFEQLPFGPEYRVVEDGGYMVSFDGAASGNTVGDLFDAAVEPKTTSGVEDGAVAVKVTNTDKTTAVTASKVWDDADNQDGLRTDVTFTLKKTVGNDASDVAVAVIKAGATGDGLTVSWGNLPVYEQGEAIQYTVTEDSDCLKAGADGKAAYASSVTCAKDENGEDIANDFVVTNTHTPQVQPPATPESPDKGTPTDQAPITGDNLVIVLAVAAIAAGALITCLVAWRKRRAKNYVGSLDDWFDKGGPYVS